MSRFTVFVGGVHGVGKGRICQSMQQEMCCEYISASSLLKWNDVTKDVKDVEANQNLLARLLSQIINADKVFIIDGHFALWNQEGDVEAVSSGLFKACRPEVIMIIVENADIVAKRLKERDGINYDVEKLERLQVVEIENAKSVAKSLMAKLFIVKSTDDKQIESTLQDIKRLSINKPSE